MAHKPESFRVDAKKKTITIYTNIEQERAEQIAIDAYLRMGYSLLVDEKKKGTTVKDVKKEMGVDADALAKFEEIYGEKIPDDKKEDKDYLKEHGFHGAMKYYQEWKKGRENKKNDQADAVVGEK